MRDPRRWFGIVAVPLILLLACAPGGGQRGQGDQRKGPITVGVSSSFAENQIIAEMYAQVLEDAGYEVRRQLSLESREISQPALEKGEIEVKPEYLASLLAYLDPNAPASSNATENADRIRTLLEGKQIALLEPSRANDTNALVVTRQTAQERNLRRVSDLAPIAGSLTLGGPPECPNRPFCIPGLRDTYGITFGSFRPLDVGGPLTVAALEGGEIDVAVLFTTSSVIRQRGLVLLEDDKNLQRADNITPVVNRRVLNDEVEGLLNGVSAQLTTENITDLNTRVEVERQDPADVARNFLREKRLI
ncbi:MAG: ABC transporter substrate-binding protein [Actinomycetota bacterium]|nr:ABC transporter substrate-binding protein [Actinomycetota bacterium]